jgi:hypothetical protein
MMEALAVDHRVPALHQQLSSLPDDRQGKTIREAINDAALGAFAVFVTQSPSFLAYQRTMQHANGRSNAARLLRMGAIPGEHQIRTWLDPVAPAQLFPVCAEVYAVLEGAGPMWSWRVFADQRLIAVDGTEYVASQEIHGARCSQRTHPHGQLTYVPQAITPVIVAPGQPEVLTLEPECSTPQDGHATPDGAQVAATRWIARQAGRYRRVTI